MRHYDNSGYYKEYTHIVAIKEMSACNDTVGDMWLETKTFDRKTPVEEIIEWSKYTGGRLIITIDEPEKTDKE